MELQPQPDVRKKQAAHEQGDPQGSCHTTRALWPGVHEPSDLHSFDLDGIDAASVAIGSEPRTVHQFDAVPPCTPSEALAGPDGGPYGAGTRSVA